MFSCITISTGNDIACILVFRPGSSLCYNRFSLRAGIRDNLFGLFSSLGKDVFDRLGISNISSRFFRSDSNGFGYNCFNCLGFGYIIKSRSWEQAGPFTYFGDRLFPLNGHDMNASHPFDFLDLVDNIDTDVNSFLLFVSGTLHPLNDFIGHVHPRNEFLHVSCHAKRFRRGNSGQDIGFLLKPHITAHLHEFCKFIYIVYDLGLDKIGAGSDFLAQSNSTELKGIGKRIGRGTKKKFGRLSFYFFTALKLFRIPHISNHAEHLDGIHIKNAF